MKTSRRELIRSGVSFISLGMASSSLGAQPPTTSRQPDSLFQQAIPEPTGQNGYEEFVQAAELIAQSPVRATLQAAEATLEKKRNAIADPISAQALSLMRQGLQKPVFPPRPLRVDTRFPEFTRFALLIRLLTVEQYVLLAGGRTQQALSSLRDGLLFSRAIQGATDLSNVYQSESMIKTLAQSFALHLSQLSATDCDYLLRVCQDWQRPPNPAIAMIQLERKSCAEALARVRAHPDLLVQWWPDEVTGAGEPERDLAAVARSNPADYNREIDRADAFVNAYFNQALEQLNRPVWERTSTVMPEEVSAARRLAYSLCYADNMDRMLDRLTQAQVWVVLLACHAAIRRYRWEHDRLPASLELLHLDELAHDPFTGNSLHYSVHGLDYELGSAGPKDRNQSPDAVNGRQPVLLLSR